MNRIAKVLSQISDDMLMHYGVARRSGRYPWGSGDNPYNSKGVTYDADTINLGCDIDMHYYKLKNVSWENGGGITGTMRFVQVGGMNSDGTVSNWSNNAYLQFERGVLIKAGWYDY